MHAQTWACGPDNRGMHSAVDSDSDTATNPAISSPCPAAEQQPLQCRVQWAAPHDSYLLAAIVAGPFTHTYDPGDDRTSWRGLQGSYMQEHAASTWSWPVDASDGAIDCIDTGVLFTGSADSLVKVQRAIMRRLHCSTTLILAGVLANTRPGTLMSCHDHGATTAPKQVRAQAQQHCRLSKRTWRWVWVPSRPTPTMCAA